MPDLGKLNTFRHIPFKVSKFAEHFFVLCIEQCVLTLDYQKHQQNLSWKPNRPRSPSDVALRFLSVLLLNSHDFGIHFRHILRFKTHIINVWSLSCACVNQDSNHCILHIFYLFHMLPPDKNDLATGRTAKCLSDQPHPQEKPCQAIEKERSWNSPCRNREAISRVPRRRRIRPKHANSGEGLG